MDALIRNCPNRSNRRVAIPLVPLRITSMWGVGVLIYKTEDGYYGVRLDGETRTDEYPAEHVTVLR